MSDALTGPQRATLAVLAGAAQPLTPRQVARALWPDSPAWERRTRGRRTGTVSGAMGGTMPMKAARLLWALNERGVAEKADPVDRDSNLWALTPLGERVVAGTAEPKPKPVRPVPVPVVRMRKPPRTPRV